MQRAELQRHFHPAVLSDTPQRVLSAEALRRATMIVATQAEAFAVEIEQNPTLVDGPTDALRLFAALICDSAGVALQPAAGSA